MNFAPATEQMLQWFIILAGVLIIPLTVGLMVVIFKLAFLIHSISDFLAFATYELSPVIKDLRVVVSQVGDISERASTGVQTLENTLHQARPMLQQGVSQAKSGVSAFFSGIGRSFSRSRE